MLPKRIQFVCLAGMPYHARIALCSGGAAGVCNTQPCILSCSACLCGVSSEFQSVAHTAISVFHKPCRVAVRELSSTSDAAGQLGKLHMELDHTRAKESLARSALNRSELERLELERQARALKQQVASLNVQLAVAQDHARWVPGSEQGLQGKAVAPASDHQHGSRV